VPLSQRTKAVPVIANLARRQGNGAIAFVTHRPVGAGDQQIVCAGLCPGLVWL
jgi:hypothetical protein